MKTYSLPLKILQITTMNTLLYFDLMKALYIAFINNLSSNNIALL